MAFLFRAALAFLSGKASGGSDVVFVADNLAVFSEIVVSHYRDTALAA
jgi:hypothetical protein